MAPGPHQTQSCSGRMALEVKPRGVLHHQNRLVRRCTLGRLLLMRLENGLDGHPLIIEEAISPFGVLPGTAGFGHTPRGGLGKMRGNFYQAFHQSFVRKNSAGKFP